ncbi:hypothetical protein [Frigoribacterium salinisoli]
MFLVVDWVRGRTIHDDEAVTPVQRCLLLSLAAGLLFAVLSVAEYLDAGRD